MKDKKQSVTSRIPGFYQLSVPERIRTLLDQGLISSEDYQSLLDGSYALNTYVADKMIENVVGVFGLPVGLALNFVVNGQDVVIPMVVEEPSIVAALSSAAKTARHAGGFEASTTAPVLIGQVQVVSVPDPDKARSKLLAEKALILEAANNLHPRMLARGGGAKDIEVRLIDAQSGPMLALHLLVDTRDAMGANLVNTMCEGVAPLIERITGGRVYLRILSNLTDQALVRVRMTVSPEVLATKGFTGEQVRDGIISASDFALADPYRAATHNKGIMNGVDAVAIATGNDWRALEAAAHAYAARTGRYTALTRFSTGANGCLVGEMEMPMKVGTVGASLESNPMVAMNLRLLRIQSASALAEVMGSVGLAQNFSALRALATEGIQQGHMNLHARSVATTAGVSSDLFDQVVKALIESGEIKVWKAEQIQAQLATKIASKKQASAAKKTPTSACGKVILLGEHAVVYGRRALAAPVPLAIYGSLSQASAKGVQLVIPNWHVHIHAPESALLPSGYGQLLHQVLLDLKLDSEPIHLQMNATIPAGMGLGSSAALAVAIMRTLSEHFALGLSDEAINQKAYQCEQLVHGTASGVDNTIATYGQMICFRKNEAGEAPDMMTIKTAKPLEVVIGFTKLAGSTSAAVGRVRQSWQKDPARYEAIFDAIDELVGEGIKAINASDLQKLGELMNLCQGYLNALQVSSPQLETLVQVARDAGALGAKLTGGGLGGSILALCDGNSLAVESAIRRSGYEAMRHFLE